ncbi:unnamed protein product, partial [Ectocarpus sp. 8 AP-2014]
ISLESDEPQRGISAANPMYLRRMRMMVKASEPPKPREEKIYPFRPWKPHIWERMFRCDFCLRVVSSGITRVPCIVCDIVAHIGCLHNAVLEAEGGTRSPAECGTGIGNDLRVVLGQKPQRTAFDDDDSGVLGGSSDGASDTSGSEAGHEPRVWVCGHCTKEHLLQMEEKGEW